MTKAMTHIDEKTLDLYVLDAEEVKPRRAEIEAHLKECSDCAELFAELTRYYAEVRKIKEEHEKKRSQALTVRSMIVRMPPLEGGAPLSEIPKTLPARIVLFVLRHPVVSSLSFLSLLLAIVLLTYPREPEKDPNPAYARAKEEFLVAYNKDGQEIWRKNIGYGYDVANFAAYIKPHPERVLTTVDVDGDGRSEVMGIFGWVPRIDAGLEVPLRNSVVCYDSEGSERWRYEFHRQITVGGVQYSDDFRFYLMAAADYDQDGSPEVIGAVGHITWSPNALVRLRATDGSLISEYWHDGWLSYFIDRDIDGDGIEELFFAGENNQFQRACLVVFDPRRIEGNGPASQGFVTQAVSGGTEKFYVLFPAAKLERFWTIPSNKPVVLKIGSDGLIEVQVYEETRRAGGGAVIYYFDSTLKCVKVQASESFANVHKILENEGEVARKLDDQYLEDLRKQVLYWDGERFISTPTMNKRYVEITKNKTLP